MIGFDQYMMQKIDEGKRHIPIPHSDIEKWLSSLELLKRDLEEFKKAKKIAASRLAQLAKPKMPSRKPEEPKKKDEKQPEEPKKHKKKEKKTRIKFRKTKNK